jgi:SAM-dependent methyltransferase
VNGRLVMEWLGQGQRAGRLLKSDLFDEAVGKGLYPWLATLAASVEGVDVSEGVVEAARRRYPALDAQQADVRRLPFPDGAFDAIVSCSTLDHFESLADLERALAELARVLAPGGRLLVTLDNAGNPLVALRNRLPRGWLASTRIVPCYVGATCDSEGLVRRLRALGLDVRRTAALMHVPRVAALALGGVWRDFDRGLGLVIAGERLAGLPTRNLTGQFVAALAVRR